MGKSEAAASAHELKRCRTQAGLSVPASSIKLERTRGAIEGSRLRLKRKRVKGRGRMSDWRWRQRDQTKGQGEAGYGQRDGPRLYHTSISPDSVRTSISV